MPRFAAHIRAWVLRLRRTTSFDTSAMILSRCASDPMSRYLRSLDATIGVAKACASAHQPSSSAASEATERVVSRGPTGESDVVLFPVPAPSSEMAGDRNLKTVSTFERWRSTAQAAAPLPIWTGPLLGPDSLQREDYSVGRRLGEQTRQPGPILPPNVQRIFRKDRMETVWGSKGLCEEPQPRIGGGLGRMEPEQGAASRYPG